MSGSWEKWMETGPVYYEVSVGPAIWRRHFDQIHPTLLLEVPLELSSEQISDREGTTIGTPYDVREHNQSDFIIVGITHSCYVVLSY